MIHPIKIASTLADETRFQIYEYMLKKHAVCNVQEIADTFQIHPNVARLHLTKLAEIQLIHAEFLKTGKGGRPGRVYRVNQDGVQLSFPRQDHRLMLEWILDTITELGDEAIELGKQKAFSYGQKTILQAYPNAPKLSQNERIDILQEQAALIGYVAEIEQKDHSFSISFTIHSCPFQSLLTKYSDVICQLHEKFLNGQVTALFGQLKFEQKTNMLHNCADCIYAISNG